MHEEHVQLLFTPNHIFSGGKISLIPLPQQISRAAQPILQNMKQEEDIILCTLTSSERGT